MPAGYFVQGTLTGLQGESLTLALGQEELVLSEDGSFAFTSTLLDGDAVEASVASPPTNPDQDCTITGPSVVEAANVNLEVRCATPIRHVILVGLDGFGGNFVGPADTPRLDTLMEESVWTLQMQNGLPTSSSTNWMSMIGGSTPDQHGVLDNTWQPGDSNPPPTLFAALREAESGAEIGAFHDWADFYRLVEPDVADVMTHPGDEHETMDAAINWIVAEEPRFTFIHLDHVDHAGHFNTWGSDAYWQAGADADALVGELIDALVEFDLWPYTALVVSADHGGAGFAHGADTNDERPIPFIVRTPQGSEHQLTREVRIWDIASTTLALLDVPQPDSWLGRPIDEVFGGFADDSIPSTGLEFVSTDSYAFLWDDTGSLAWNDASAWRPMAPAGYFVLGDVARGSHDAPSTGTLVVRSPDPLALAMPIGYEEIWNTGGAGGEHDASFWNPLPPPGYACLGTVVGPAPGIAPELDAIRCVHQSLLVQASSSLTWEDTGSGASWDGSFWSCEGNPTASLVPQAFVTRRHHSGPGFPKCFGLDPASAQPG
jgi:hypothetical protein